MIGSRIAFLAGALALLLVTLTTGATAADPAPSPAFAFEFVPTGRLAHGRIGHTATLLSDGRVLVVGGYEAVTAEVWDPATGTWSMAGVMRSTREGHRATLLPDGRVAVSGGHRSGSDIEPSSEVWDPLTATFSPAGSMEDAVSPMARPLFPELSYRDGARLTPLADGQVLVTGRWEKVDPDCSPVCRLHMIPSASIWDPVSESSVDVGPMNEARAEHTATLLQDGRVLIVGAHDHGPTDATAEIFQPVGFVPAQG